MNRRNVILADVLQHVETLRIDGCTERPVHAVQYDSRRVGQGDVFVAIRGFNSDGNMFINAAIENGASAIVTDSPASIKGLQAAGDAVTQPAMVLVRDGRVALAELANACYEFPTRDIILIGVTGTNGKTTTTHIVRHILESAGIATGLIGTIESKIGATVVPMDHTTPESIELCGIIAMMKERGAKAVVMEVSSHALALERVRGFEFDAAVLTNVTQDHLDFHVTMEAYAEAKSRLFGMLQDTATAVINADEPYGAMMERRTVAHIVHFGMEHAADVGAENVRYSTAGTQFLLTMGRERWDVATPYLGAFNVYNVLGGVAAARAAGVPASDIVDSLASLPQVRGRMERMRLPVGAVVVVDFAHSPDALQRALESLRALMPENAGNLITVFGCGGDRDRTKRPLMGAIAARLSDFAIVTSDNPRTEDPMAIIAGVLGGTAAGSNIAVIPERGAAIESALAMARADDVVLIAGKGHETYQSIAGTKFPFDDRERVRAWIERCAGER